MFVKRGRGVLGATLLSLTLSACTDADTPKDLHDDAATQAAAALAQGHEVLSADPDQVPTFLRGRFGEVPTGKLALKGLQTHSLAPVLARVAPLFKLDTEQLFLKKAYVGSDGDTHYRFGVRYHGVEVLGAELRLHARDGQVFAVNGNARGGLAALQSDPIGVDLAKANALADKGSVPGLVVRKAPALVYWRDQDQLILSWRVLVAGAKQDGTPVKESVLVNARSGEVFERFNHIHSALDRIVYDGQNTNDLPGTVARREGEAPHADPVVNAAYDNTGAVWRCYKELFDRDSYDDLGATLHSTVHHRVNYVNAYWDGEQMVFGDGDGTTAINLAYGLDVIAHELTHAVTEVDSDLIYSGESGGLNESISDIFGAVCEWHSEGKVINEGTYLVGEDVWTPEVPGDALRYMNNPTQDGDSLDDYHNYSNGVDVHYSSGISNLAFYLLAQGGTHPRFPTRPAVTGIGIEMAGRIFYKANRDLLMPNSTFDAARIATEQAAVQLGYDASVVASVAAAWKAVNVGVVFEPTDPFELERNVPVVLSGTASGAKEYGWAEVPEGATNLRFTLSGTTGDPDLYIRQGNYPTTGLYDCRPYRSGANEECVFPTPTAGKWYAMVNTYTPYTNASLVMKFDGGFFPLEPNVVVSGLSAPANGSHGYIVQVPARANGKPRSVTVQLLGGTGNADLYVRMGAIPNHYEYDCRGMKETNAEKCVIPQVTSGKLYVWVVGAKGGYQNTAILVSYPP
nr:M4 family metallopeptidase [Myxococcus sp. MH1]